jgi:hypothetical protein
MAELNEERFLELISCEESESAEFMKALRIKARKGY